MTPQWTDPSGATISVPSTGNAVADKRAIYARLPDLLADLRATGAFHRALAEMREKQSRIERA